MDRSWMYGGNDTLEFINGVTEFCDSAMKNQSISGMEGFYCPCVDCCNVDVVSTIYELREHILRRGFRPEYHVWVWHGEQGVYRGPNSFDNESSGSEIPVVEALHVGLDDELDFNDEVDEDDVDRMDDMKEAIEDQNDNNPRVYEALSEAALKPLYPGCEDYTKLSGVLTLYHIKTV